jgi:hypothetical protein
MMRSHGDLLQHKITVWDENGNPTAVPTTDHAKELGMKMYEAGHRNIHITTDSLRLRKYLTVPL